MIDVEAYRRRLQELEQRRRPARVGGRLARELDDLRRDEAKARKATAEAEIRAAHARFVAEAAVIGARYRRAKADEE